MRKIVHFHVLGLILSYIRHLRLNSTCLCACFYIRVCTIRGTSECSSDPCWYNPCTCIFVHVYIISQHSGLNGLMTSYIRFGADILPIMWHISRDRFCNTLFPNISSFMAPLPTEKPYNSYCCNKIYTEICILYDLSQFVPVSDTTSLQLVLSLV